MYMYVYTHTFSGVVRLSQRWWNPIPFLRRSPKSTRSFFFGILRSMGGLSTGVVRV